MLVPQAVEPELFQIITVCAFKFPTNPRITANNPTHFPSLKTGEAIFQTGRRGRRFGILDVGCWNWNNWRRWRGWNLAPLKERLDAERVTSGDNEDSLFSATAGRTHVAGRCVLNWCIFLAVLVQSGSAFRTLVGLFQKRDAGRFGMKE